MKHAIITFIIKLYYTCGQCLLILVVVITNRPIQNISYVILAYLLLQVLRFINNVVCI